MLERLLKRLRGKRGQANVDAVVNSFEQNINTLDTAVDGINGEITSNAVEQWLLEDRNNALRKHRQRALKVRQKLAEFVV